MKKVFGWLVAIALIGGFAMQMKNNPKSTGKAGAHVINETLDVGAGIMEGVVTFVGALDF